MGIYARRPWRFLGQVGADLFVVVWIIAWWLTSRLVERTIAAVASPARETAFAATRMATEFGQAAQQAGEVPGLGSRLRRPFDAASESLGGLVTSANDQVTSIEHLANVVGWLVLIIPASTVLALWLPRRIRFFLRARAAQHFIDSSADLDLFALRAMASQPMHVLAKISDDPVRAWRGGDRAVINQLAEVELRRSGLRLPADRVG
jgi:hypothetical protein